MGQLDERVIIITGATSGMGKAIALTFAKEGASLVLSGRNNLRAIELMSEIAAFSKNSIFIEGDISLVEVNEKLVDQAIASYGKLDTVVANAGSLGLGAITDLSVESWHQTLDTNLNALFYISKFAIPHMIKNGSGNILANASIAAFKSFPNHPAYCVSKAGQVALVKQLASEYGPTIRANAMCPGPIDTPLIWDSAKAFPDPENAVKQAGDRTFLKRLGTADEVAKLALFLVSEASSFITASTFNIDGGVTAS